MLVVVLAEDYQVQLARTRLRAWRMLGLATVSSGIREPCFCMVCMHMQFVAYLAGYGWQTAGLVSVSDFKARHFRAVAHEQAATTDGRMIPGLAANGGEARDFQVPLRRRLDQRQVAVAA